jgi:hypothetical protein
MKLLFAILLISLSGCAVRIIAPEPYFVVPQQRTWHYHNPYARSPMYPNYRRD